MRRIRFVAAAAVFLAVALGPAQPSGAAPVAVFAGPVTGTMSTGPLPLLPAPSGTSISFSGVGVVADANPPLPTVGTTTLSCAFSFPSSESLLIGTSIGSYNGGCSLGSGAMPCSASYTRGYAAVVFMSGICQSAMYPGPLRLTAELVWAGFPSGSGPVAGVVELTP